MRNEKMVKGFGAKVGEERIKRKRKTIAATVTCTGRDCHVVPLTPVHDALPR